MLFWSAYLAFHTSYVNKHLILTNKKPFMYLKFNYVSNHFKCHNTHTPTHIPLCYPATDVTFKCTFRVMLFSHMFVDVIYCFLRITYTNMLFTCDGTGVDIRNQHTIIVLSVCVYIFRTHALYGYVSGNTRIQLYAHHRHC